MFVGLVAAWVALCCLLGSVFPIGAVGILLYPLLGGVMFLIYMRVADWHHDRTAEARRWQALVELSRSRLAKEDKAHSQMLARLVESAEHTRRNIRRIMSDDKDGRDDGRG